MFKTFFFTELKYTLKQPMVYIFLGLFSLLVFGSAASENVTIGGSVGNVFKNAPHTITVWTTIMSVFGLLIATAFFNNAALRDFKNEFNEIIFSTPLSKSGYFFGKFFGALILATIPLLGVFIGTILGSVLGPAFGWLDADRFGDFYLETFINNYLLFIVPNMFFAGSIIFALANIWKNTVISFIGAIAIMMGYIISSNLISEMDNETIAGLIDIFGITTYEVQSKYYTTIEKNTLSPGFSGLLLWNRLIWISVGTVVLILSYLRFSFQEKNKKVRKKKKKKDEARTIFSSPNVSTTYNNNTYWLQFKSFFYTNFISIVKSVTFKIILVLGIIMLISNLINGFEYFGLQSYPLTYKLIDTINGLSGLFVVIIMVFFSGELIWRDRDNKINEVVDATPHTSIISLASKTLSLVATTVIIHGTMIIGGIIYQLVKGYTKIELDVYLLDFFYSNFIFYVVWSGVLVAIQVIVNHKYIGYFISILLIFAWELILLAFDVDSNMLLIGDGPSLRYSDMNQFGPGLTGALWFNAYWLSLAFALLLIAGALWSRGTTSSLKERIKNGFSKAPKKYKLLILSSSALWLFLTAFVYYNTQILNPYNTSDERKEQSANYEKKFKKYENVDLPKITDIKYYVDIYPYIRDVHVKAEVLLINEGQNPIDSIHFNVSKNWKAEINIPNSKLIFEDDEHGYMIYLLEDMMQPNKTRKIGIKTKYLSKGFTNGVGNTNVVANGTFINNFEVLPNLGYSSSNELSDRNDRKKYDLEPKERMPALKENCVEDCMKNYLTDGHSDYITAETIISTASDQMAIAPGTLVKKWTENERNYYHYKVDQASQNFYSFISAKFEVARRKWRDIDLEVYYDKKHGINVEMMLDAMERSLAYYTENFGPYFHKQCRIIEFPRYATFAQAFPGTMPYSEAIGFVINLEDETENNVIDAVISHEIGHQWWAHQVVGATMQGATLTSESFSEYSSLMTMKSISKTPMKMREFLKYDHDRYLRGRGQELIKELPLYKVENQQYIHYGKGSVILYALQDYIGEEKVNLAMRNFLEEFRYRKAPYPTSLDFLKHLDSMVPDSLKYLIDDWFKEITLYDNRLKEATYQKLDNGKYSITILVEATKIKADTLGVETITNMNDWVDIGVFMDEDEENLYYQKRVKIDKSQMTFTFELDSLPAKAAIDPRHLLIDRVYKDNSKKLREAKI